MSFANFNYGSVSEPNVPPGFKFNPEVWTEAFIHEYMSEVHLPSDAEGKRMTVYKKVGKVLRLADVPEDPGIYVIRLWDDPSGNFTYIGSADNLWVRLSQQLGTAGERYFEKGKIYEIRYARTSIRNFREAKKYPKQISPYGAEPNNEAHRIAEGLAILFFKPIKNTGTDWKGALRNAIRNQQNHQIFQEAERLGFWCGSQRDKDDYVTKLISQII